MKLCIMSSPWLENRRFRLCSLWAEKLLADASTNWCLSAWLAFLTILELRLDNVILESRSLRAVPHLTFLYVITLSLSESLQPTGVSY